METLCRVCIEKAAECTLLNIKIKNSSNLTFFDFFNKCTSLNACESDKLPQSLCSICTHSMKTFYSFVKLAEKSDTILREALKNSIATERYDDNREFSWEEVTLTNGKIEKESEDCNREDSFHCHASTNSTGSSLYVLDIVKEEPRISESPSIVAKINESDEFFSNLGHPEGSIEEPDDILSCLAEHLASIHAEHSESEDDTPVSLLKKRSVKSEDETSQRDFLPKAHCIPSNVKEKADKSKVESKEIIKEGASDPQNILQSDRLIGNRENSCEEITIRNEKVEEEFEDYNKEDSFHCQTSKNPTRSSLFILDIVKEEPRISEHTSIVAKINSSDEFYSNLDHSEGSIEAPDDISSCKDGKDAVNSDSEDDVPISLLKRRLVKNKETDSQKTKIEKSYNCKECDMIFNDKEEFRPHCRNHVCGDKHECNICGKMFAKRKSLQCHLLTHEEKNKYKCSICGKDFKYASNRYRHMRIHSSGKPFECEICNNKFTAKYNLKIHMEIHNGIKYKCGQCGKEFKYPHGLRSHMKWHTNPKPFKCDNCGKLFANKWNYNKHTEICKSVAKSYQKTRRKGLTKKKCEECDIAFNNKQEFENHCKNHVYGVTRDDEKRYKCSICGNDFKYLVNLHKHMKIHSGRKSLECKICSKAFATKYYLRDHMEIHSGILKKCGQCDREFKSSLSLKKHVKWHANPKPYRCENCEKLFANKCNLVRHMEICKPVANSNQKARRKGHTKKKCKECDVVFNDKQEFEKHCRNHAYGVIRDKKRKYKCSICGKGFKLLLNFCNHMKIHCDGKPFECKICNNKFTTTNNLKLHMDNHKGGPKKCDQCGKELKNRDSLRCHMKWHTNPKPLKCEKCGKSLSRRCNFARHLEICKPISNLNERTGTVTVEESSFTGKETKKS